MVYSEILKSGRSNPARITKFDKDFSNRLDFENTKVPVKTRDIHKIEKENSISVTVVVYKNKEKHPIYASKKCREDKHVDLLLVGEGKRHYA